MIAGSIMLVVVAFFFLSRALSWNYVSDFVKERSEPNTDINEPEQIIKNEFVSISVSLDQSQYEELLELVEQLRDLYPHIQVEVTNYIDQSMNYADWENSMKLGEIGDVSLIANEWILPLSIQGLLQPVDRLMNSEALAAQLTGYIDALKWNGYTWAIPYTSNPYIILKHNTITSIEQQSLTNEGTKTEGNIDEQVIGNEGEEAVAVSQINTWEQLLMYAAELESGQSEHPLLNIEKDYAAMLVWFSYWSNIKDQGILPAMLQAEQGQQLEWLVEHQQLFTSSILEEEKFPLLYMVTWDEYVKNRNILDKHYSLESVQIPVPWFNGKSFVLNAKYEEAGNVVAWLEKLNQLASSNAIQSKAAPIRMLDYALSSHTDSQIMDQSLSQKLTPSQMMSVSPLWPVTFEQLQLEWSKLETVEEKLLFLQSLEIND